MSFLAQAPDLFTKRRDITVSPRTEKDAENPADSQPRFGGALSGIAIVEKREIRAAFQREGKSLGFAGVKTGAEMSSHGLTQGSDLQPAVAERCIEQSCRRGMP